MRFDSGHISWKLKPMDTLLYCLWAWGDLQKISLYLSFPLKSVPIDISIFHVCSGCKVAQSVFMFKFFNIEPTNTTATTTTTTYSSTLLIELLSWVFLSILAVQINNTLKNALREVAEERQPSFWKIRTDPMLYKNLSIDWQ